MASVGQTRHPASSLDEFDDGSIAVVLGTRPEMIKLSGIVRRLGDAASIIHTGQHYTPELSDSFFDELGLPEPVHRLQIGGAHRADQIRSAVSALTRMMSDEPPRAVLIQGDTNTAFAGAVSAHALDIPLVHLDAGLRSFDRRMPQEHNRLVADHLADLLLAPTEDAKRNLTNEAIAPHRVRVVGSTLVEAINRFQPDAHQRKDIMGDLGVDEPFVLATLHRPENVDDGPTLARLIDQLGQIDAPTVLLVHPHTKARLDDMEVDAPDNLVLRDPMGYAEFLALETECAVIVSDSGGVQEESSVLKRPMVVVRRSTEHPEVVGTFARLTAPGPQISEIVNEWLGDIDTVHADLSSIATPYGDDSAPDAGVDAIAALIADT